MNTPQLKKWRQPFLFMSLVSLLTAGLNAAVPNLINFQGKLLDTSKNPQNGTFSMTFRICDSLAASCASPEWTETQGSVAVTNGVFSVQLGAVTPITSSVFSSDTRYLEIVVGGETLSPRERLITNPYSQRAAVADSLDSSNSDYIQNTNSLQSGSTFYVSSGTVNGNLTVGGVITAGTGINTITTAAGLLDATQLTNNVPNTSIDGSSVTLQGNTFNGASQLVQLNGSSGLDLSGTLTFNSVSADISSSDQTLTLNSSGGNVGIGLTSPSATLHVSSSSAGTNDDVLTVSSGTTASQELLTVKGDGIVEVAGSVSESNKYIQVYHNGGGTAFATTPSFTSVPWDQQTFVDAIFSHDTGVNNTRITVNRTGLYRITYMVNTDKDTNNTRSILEMRCYVNNTTEVVPSRVTSYNRQNAQGEGTASASFLVSLNDGDYFEIQGSELLGNNIFTNSGNRASWVIGEFIR